jgi:hypothetical protein
MNDDELVKALRKRSAMIGVSGTDSINMNHAATRIEQIAKENAEPKEAQRWVPEDSKQ